MQINLTPTEAQAIADLIDKEVRMSGLQSAATLGPIARTIIEAAQAEQQQQQEQETEDNG